MTLLSSVELLHRLILIWFIIAEFVVLLWNNLHYIKHYKNECDQYIFGESSIQSNQCSLIPEQLTRMSQNGLIIHQYNDFFSFKGLK